MFLQNNTEGDKIKRVAITIIPVDKVIKALSEMPLNRFIILMLTTAICCHSIFG